ncbi:uncharacterized protein LOC144884296 isoform X8 [Branchiostoma floridae x Branchiostoma japonicum]
MREDVSMICARRGQGKWQTLVFVLVLVGFGYGVYEYNQLQIRHQHAEHRSQKYQSQQESLSAQLQVVYEHRSRLEKSLQKERNEHKKTKEEYEQKQIESEQVLAKEKQEAENRYDSLNQQYKMLRNQHEDLEREYASLQDQHVRLGDEHKKIVDQHLDNYQKLKDQKDTDLQRLKEVIQNLKERNAQLQADQEELVKQITISQETADQPGAQHPLFVQVPGAGGEDLEVGGGLHPGLDETHKQLLEAQKRRQELQNQFRGGLGLPDENAIEKDKLGDKKDSNSNQIIHQDEYQVGKVGNGDGKDLDDQDGIQSMRGRSNFIGQQLAGNQQDGADQLLAGGDRLQPLGDDPDKQLQLHQVDEGNQVQADGNLHHPLDAGNEDDDEEKNEDGKVLDQDDLEDKGMQPLGQAGEEAEGGQDAQPGDQGPFAVGQDMDQDQPEQQGAAPLGIDQPLVKHEVEVLVPGGQESDQQMMQVERPDQNLPQVAVDHEVQVDHPLAGGGQVADNNIQPVVQLPDLMPVQNRDGDNMADPVNDDNRGMQDVDKDFDDGNEDQANDQVEGGVGDGHGDDDDDDDDDDRELHDGIAQVKAGGDIRQREDQDEFQNDRGFARRQPLSHPLNRHAR